jgi:hypothetical protein
MSDVTKDNVDQLIHASTTNIKVQILRFMCLVYKKAALFSIDADKLGKFPFLAPPRRVFSMQ